jgi:hypothetical protein
MRMRPFKILQKFKDQLDSPRQGRYKSKLRMEQQYNERQLLDTSQVIAITNIFNNTYGTMQGHRYKFVEQQNSKK